jgi:hypothetical protein
VAGGVNEGVEEEDESEVDEDGEDEISVSFMKDWGEEVIAYQD